jgi:glycosyltransferase 2 family protein
LSDRASRLVRTFAEGLAIVRQPARLLAAIALSLPLWLSIALGIWLVTRAFHIEMPFTGSFLLVALLVVGVAVPTPGAVGGFHYFYRLGTTAFFAAPSDRAVGAALVLHAVSFVPVAIAGMVLLAQEGLSLSRLGALARTGGAEGAA